MPKNLKEEPFTILERIALTENMKKKIKWGLFCEKFKISKKTYNAVNEWGL